MEAELVPATAKDVATVINDLRPADILEIQASHGPDVAREVKLAADTGETWAGRVDGQTLCVFGVIDRTLSGGGTVWMVGRPLLEKHQYVFVRNSRRWVKFMLARYAYLENYVHDENTASKRWLKWLGFGFDEGTVPLGHSAARFRRFFQTGDCNVR